MVIVVITTYNQHVKYVCTDVQTYNYKVNHNSDLSMLALHIRNKGSYIRM